MAIRAPDGAKNDNNNIKNENNIMKNKKKQYKEDEHIHILRVLYGNKITSLQSRLFEGLTSLQVEFIIRALDIRVDMIILVAIFKSTISLILTHPRHLPAAVDQYIICNM